MISRSAHGFPWATRPTMTAAAPLVASTVSAFAREHFAKRRADAAGAARYERSLLLE